MESRESIKKKVTDNLLILGLNQSNIKPKAFETLIKIESYFTERTEIKNDLNNKLKENEVTFMSVADDLHLTRSNLYGNEIFKTYIKYSLDCFNKDNINIKANKLKAEMADAEKRIANTCETIIEYANAQVENSLLNDEIKTQSEKIAKLRKRNKELEGEIITLKEKIRRLEKEQKKDSTVIPF